MAPPAYRLSLCRWNTHGTVTRLADVNPNQIVPDVVSGSPQTAHNSSCGPAKPRGTRGVRRRNTRPTSSASVAQTDGSECEMRLSKDEGCLLSRNAGASLNSHKTFQQVRRAQKHACRPPFQGVELATAASGRALAANCRRFSKCDGGLEVVSMWHQ